MEGEAAVIARSRGELADRLAGWPHGEDETWAVVFMGALPSAAELAVAREAARLCDRVVGVVGGLRQQSANEPFGPKLAETCRAAGCDIIWLVKDVRGHVTVDCGVEGINGTLLMQALLTVLPTLVMAPRADINLVRALRNLQGMADFFSLRVG